MVHFYILSVLWRKDFNFDEVQLIYEIQLWCDIYSILPNPSSQILSSTYISRSFIILGFTFGTLPKGTNFYIVWDIDYSTFFAYGYPIVSATIWIVFVEKLSFLHWIASIVVKTNGPYTY